MYLADDKYIVTNLDNVINVNSLVAFITSHNTIDKNLTFLHNFWQIIYCKSGECTWNIDGKLFAMKKDDIIITPPHTVRRCEDYDESNIVCYISFFSNSGKLKDMQKKTIALSPKLKRKLVSAINDITNHFQRNLIYLSPKPTTTDIDLQRIKNKLERFLLDLYSKEFSDLNTLSNPKPHTQDEYFLSALTFLQTNIHRDMTISEIVSETGIGRSTLENIFRQNEGVGIKAYFTRMKIDAAKEMIISKRYSMTYIAQALGFINVHSFSRTFKAQTGASPKKYQSYF